MNNYQKNLDEIVESIAVPESAYKAAEKRYKDLGDWLHDESKASCARFSPEVRPQGSFRLGTTTRPWKRADYDLDMTCTLAQGIDPGSFSQRDLKELVGSDLEAYRKERGIKEDLEEKHRCWCLKYQDELSFHMDIVPSIPADAKRREELRLALGATGMDDALVRAVDAYAVSITDDQRDDYGSRNVSWPKSNTEGYAKWFESRMKLSDGALRRRAALQTTASIDDLPAHRWQTPLQQAIMILKRHRDMMFEPDPDTKPISIIITTLAGRAYQGEENLAEALDTILTHMDHYVASSFPRVANPVNPEEEDFADKWGTPEGRVLNLEGNFRQWLTQARADFGSLRDAPSDAVAASVAKASLKVVIGGGTTHAGFVPATPKVHQIEDTPPSPWMEV